MAFNRTQIEDIVNKARERGAPANFRSLNLHGCDLSNLDLEKADFRSASCHYVDFTNCSCKMANFEGAGLMFTKWKGSNCHRTNFKDASLCDADMRGVTDFFGATFTMECRSWKGLKIDPGFWYGFLFYGLLMVPPTEEAKEKLQIFLGPEHFTVLRDLYLTRQV